ncbi:TonB-dependent siderophore receptor [Endobacterium cereale]|uniref:TonB-dependent siderophore receptor n=1 Tax=Endobacterium cereale TaxID=2663029 RepID=UPI001AD9503D|nr:TonB-dependent siderophore receptor [Endobacterium cereale]MEB2847190.1 TonB-dependent siderophore receptor [Endobacterium cereale]
MAKRDVSGAEEHGAIVKSSGRRPVLALAALALSCSVALAQNASYSIPSGQLDTGLTRFGLASGIQVLYDSSVTASLRTRGVSGAKSPQEALAELLQGTNLTYRFTSPTSVTIFNPTVTATSSSGGATTLQPIIVQADAEAGWGPVEGFVATRSLTATKTDTPLLETPQAISVVSADQIEAQNATSVGATLRYTSGVNGETTGAADTRYGGLAIRGFDMNSEAFFRDGLKLPGTAYSDFQTLDPYGAERIEVLKGPSSILYGQNGPGGLVNYVSKRPTTETIREVSIQGGSFGRVETHFDLGGAIGEGSDWSYRLTGVGRSSGSQVDFVDDDRFFIAPALTYSPDKDTSLTILGNYQRDRAGWGLQFMPALGTVFSNDGRKIPVDRFLGERDFDHYNTSQASIGYLFEHSFSEDLTVRQNVRYSHLSNDQEIVYGGGYLGDPADGTLARYSDKGQSKLNTFAIDNQLQYEFDTGPVEHTLLAGLDYRWTRFADKSDYYDADPINVFDPVYSGAPTFGGNTRDAVTSQHQVGIYLQDQIKIDRWSFAFGGRYDWASTEVDDHLSGGNADKSASDFSSRAGVVYTFDNGIAPYLSYTESFSQPLDVDADGALFEPETGRQWEAGVKYQPTGFDSFFTASVFHLVRDNVIRYDAVGGSFAAVQTGQITSQGFELEGVASLTDRFNLRLAYTYLDVEITKDPNGGNQGRWPTTIPRHTASLWGDYRINDGSVLDGLGFGLGARYVGSTFGDDANSFKVPAAVVFDAAVSFKRDNYELLLNASNLFDKEYVASCFNDSFGCFYAEGRRVMAKATIRW